MRVFGVILGLILGVISWVRLLKKVGELGIVIVIGFFFFLIGLLLVASLGFSLPSDFLSQTFLVG